MKFFSNKREKMCVFFKSRGVNVALFLFIPYIIYRNPPLKKNIFSQFESTYKKCLGEE